MQKKIIRRHIENSAPLHQTLHPLLHRIYCARGVTSALELELALDFLLPFNTLLNIDKAVQCVADILMTQQSILIVGDFDADGATSTAVAVRALKSFGAKKINYLVPNRFAFGYGLTPGMIKINDQTLTQSVIITPNELITTWEPQHFDELRQEHLTRLIEMQPAIVLIGTGSELQFPPVEFYGELINAGIGVEFMDIAAACRTYNALSSEGRHVVAALIIK